MGGSQVRLNEQRDRGQPVPVQKRLEYGGRPVQPATTEKHPRVRLSSLCVQTLFQSNHVGTKVVLDTSRTWKRDLRTSR